MKKSIIYLGITLMAFSNVSLASNTHFIGKQNRGTTFFLAPTPLSVAISKGEIETVKKVIEEGANINKKFNGMTPLMFAARYNKVDIIVYLLQKGAKLDIKDSQGFTALKHAELSNAVDAIVVLKKAGSFQNQTDNSGITSSSVNVKRNYLIVDDSTFLYADLVSKSKKTTEEKIAEDDKIIENTVADEINPLDFNTINKKTILKNSTTSKGMVEAF